MGPKKAIAKKQTAKAETEKGFSGNYSVKEMSVVVRDVGCWLGFLGIEIEIGVKRGEGCLAADMEDGWVVIERGLGSGGMEGGLWMGVRAVGGVLCIGMIVWGNVGMRLIGGRVRIISCIGN
jgi:hypothetical protein